jgi:hypothetical protein
LDPGRVPPAAGREEGQHDGGGKVVGADDGRGSRGRRSVAAISGRRTSLHE